MTTFSTCAFPILEDAEAIEQIRSAVVESLPFSLIRLGDGEAVVLAYGDDMWLQDLAYLHGHWGSEGVTLGAVAEVRSDLSKALEEADMVGVRTDIIDTSLPDEVLSLTGAELIGAVVSSLRIRPEEVANLSATGARRLALLHHALSGTEWSEDQKFCSAWIHWELAASGAFDEILRSVDRVGLVTCKPGLESLVEGRFDVRATSVLIPEKHVDGKGGTSHVPDRYRTIRPELSFPEGSVVLVGAGIPGKAYCQWLKEAGCVALDVGSVFDAWVGKPSRPRVLESRFGVPGGTRVPPHLQLTPASRSTDRRLTPRWKPSGRST